MNGHDNPDIFPTEPERAVEVHRSALELPYYVERTMSGGERLQAADHLLKTLQEELPAIEVYVLLKQAASIIAESLDLAKESALLKMEGKEEQHLGAKVETKRKREREYDDPVLVKLESDLKKLQDDIKARKRLLESIPADMADTTTGEMIKKAKLLADGLQIVVTLPR